MNGNFVDINDFCIYKGKAYMSERNFNAMLVYDLESRKIVRADRFESIPANQFTYHKGCVEHNGIIYFYPFNAGIVHYYDAESDIHGCYHLNCLPNRGFNYASVSNDKLYLFPGYPENGMRVIDIKNGNITENPEWWDPEKMLHDYSNKFFYIDKCGSGVWCHLTSTDQLLITDCAAEHVDKYRIFSDNISPWGMEYDNGSFWYSACETGHFYQWSPENGLENVFEVGYKTSLSNIPDYHMKNMPYREAVPVNGKLFVIPYDKNAVYILNKETCSLELISEFPEDTVYPPLNYWYADRKILGSILYIFCNFTNLIICIDTELLTVKYIKAENSDDCYADHVKRTMNFFFDQYNSEAFIQENITYNRFGNLHGFICSLCGIQPQEEKKSGSNIGKKIYDAIAYDRR